MNRAYMKGGSMKALKLDREKILAELRLKRKSSAWLARQIGCTRQTLNNDLIRGSIKRAGVIGEILGITPKNLVKTVEVFPEEEE